MVYRKPQVIQGNISMESLVNLLKELDNLVPKFIYVHMLITIHVSQALDISLCQVPHY